LQANIIGVVSFYSASPKTAIISWFHLETVLDVINDTYTSLRWLELAEEYTGPGNYGDSDFPIDEFLKVRKVEIGTPNYMDLHGVYQTLMQVLVYLGGVSGVLSIGKNAIDWGLEVKQKWTEARVKDIELKQKDDPEIMELEKKKLAA